MNYVKSTLSYRQIGWVGDDISELNLDLYADANYGTHGGKSTSGVQLHVEGPSTCFPISGNSSSQTAVSHSTPEAEIVAAAAALRKSGIPSMIIWETTLSVQTHPTIFLQFTSGGSKSLDIEHSF